MNDMRAVIIPKSDQINADDLIGGSITITIAEVTIRPGTEQPVSIGFEGDNGKPYKPCKSMARVMVQCWGPDANKYVGRSMTLYRDPKVLWGGMAVGGIRISHMTDINGAQTMALTATKGSKKLFTVTPLVVTQERVAASPTVADWIAGTLLPGLARCATTEDVAKIQQHRKYLAASEHGTDADRIEMKRLVDAALLRIETPETPTETATEDDTFPGDRP